MKKILTGIVLFLPVVALAHVKWFANPEGYVRPYSLSDGFVLAWIAVSVVIILVGIVIDRNVNLPKKTLYKFEKFGPIVYSLSSIGFGISLIIFTLKGFIFAPNFQATNSFEIILLLLQGIAGVSLLLGAYERIGALILLFVYCANVYIFGIHEMIDAFEILGFSIYVFIVGRPRWKLTQLDDLQSVVHKLQGYAVPILRIFTGVNLVALGFTEKILSPALTRDFLNQYHWNFMSNLGYKMFSDYWFAFSAGVVEILFGVFLILGLVTRFTTLTLAVFLITTLALLGPVELVGHLPHFSIAIVFLILGGGNKLKLIS